MSPQRDQTKESDSEASKSVVDEGEMDEEDVRVKKRTSRGGNSSNNVPT